MDDVSSSDPDDSLEEIADAELSELFSPHEHEIKKKEIVKRRKSFFIFVDLHLFDLLKGRSISIIFFRFFTDKNQ